MTLGFDPDNIPEDYNDPAVRDTLTRDGVDDATILSDAKAIGREFYQRHHYGTAFNYDLKKGINGARQIDEALYRISSWNTADALEFIVLVAKWHVAHNLALSKTFDDIGFLKRSKAND